MLTRRALLRLAAGTLTTSLRPRRSWANESARIVVVGGGFAGAACAKYLRLLDKTLAVTLVTPQPQFTACPLSNSVVTGLRDLSTLRYSYQMLQHRYGMRILFAIATEVDPTVRHVRLHDGRTLAYDRLVLAPGIELRLDALEGYDKGASVVFPHAWEAGEQTLLLRRQLEAMADNGLVVISVPDNPYRCPPGPYERASLIAYYLQRTKPRAKVVILDSKDNFTKKDLFVAAWKTLYPQTLEWISGSRGGRVVRVDMQTRTLYTEFDSYKPAVANVIPPQRAAALARRSGLDRGKGWCPVHASTFESAVQPYVHVIGDAALANPMPKSAFAANIQAKACAAAVVALLHGVPVMPPVLMNTCYSLVAPDYGISIAAAYRAIDDAIVTIPGSDGTSPLDAPVATRRLEAEYARSWYANITADTFT